MRLRLILIGIAVGLTVLAGSGHANVLQQRGTFMVEYKDFDFPGGLEPQVNRSYYSSLTRKGIFGPGWASKYEVSLEVADEKIIIHEWEENRDYFFTPDAGSDDYVPAMVDEIIRAAQANKEPSTPDETESLRLKLTADAALRDSYWQKYLKLKLVSFQALPLRSNYCGCQRLRRINGGYKREVENRFESFDDSGRLTRIFDRNNNWIEMSYDARGNLSSVSDNYGRVIKFTYGAASSLVQRAEGFPSKSVTPIFVMEYSYGRRGELVGSYFQSPPGANAESAGDQALEYQYDFNYRLTRITYRDKTTTEVAYYADDMGGRVKTVKDRDLTTTRYLYIKDKNNPSHITVSLTTSGEDGRVISRGTYDYFTKRKSNGDEITVKQIENVDGDVTETDYDSETSFPLSIRRGGEVTSFEYADGLVTKKTTPAQTTFMEYDKKIRKVSRVEIHPKNAKTFTWSMFKYDAAGNLLFAKNSDGKSVEVEYDNYGRIVRMTDQNKRLIQFKYNENSKPIEITDPSLGTITVTYTQGGEIDKVHSTAGRKIALQVTSAFQNLLDIIRPAGVSFSF